MKICKKGLHEYVGRRCSECCRTHNRKMIAAKRLVNPDLNKDPKSLNCKKGNRLVV